MKPDQGGFHSIESHSDCIGHKLYKHFLLRRTILWYVPDEKIIEDQYRKNNEIHWGGDSFIFDSLNLNKTHLQIQIISFISIFRHG